MDNWDPDYPTTASRRYRDHFLEGCLEARVDLAPNPDLLSQAVTVGMGAGVPALAAGKQFGELYVRISKRREFRDKHSRNGVWNQTAYVIAAFEKVLEEKKQY